MWHDPLVRRVAFAVLALGLIVVAGTVGYALIEGWSLAEGLFMTVITLSTVGYGEVRELTPLGRAYTGLLIFCCLVGMTYWTASLTSLIVGHDLDLSGQFVRRRLLTMISKLKDHVIICGSDAMAHAVIERLARKRIPVVLVDDNRQKLQALKQQFRQLYVLEGNATNEITLAEANVLNARSVVAAMPSEIDNLLVAITCKDMGHDIPVYARSNDALLGNRMRKAGVDEVVSPCQLCGDRVAELIMAT